MKRYTLAEDEDYEGYMEILGMEESSDGEWVKYEDAAAKIARLRAVLTDLGIELVDE